MQYYLEPLDFIIYTGDSIDHHDFTQSIENNIKSIRPSNSLHTKYYKNILGKTKRRDKKKWLKYAFAC